MNHHLYYGDPKHLDLSKFRDVAQKYAAGDYRNKPAPCTIHFHNHGVPCTDKEHEIYEPKKEEDKDAVR